MSGPTGMKIGDVWWRVEGCPATKPASCVWLVPTHGRPEHHSQLSFDPTKGETAIDAGLRILQSRATSR